VAAPAGVPCPRDRPQLHERVALYVEVPRDLERLRDEAGARKLQHVPARGHRHQLEDAAAGIAEHKDGACRARGSVGLHLASVEIDVEPVRL
jgi:hypothetical protein